LDDVQPDFAFVFGAHAAMPALAMELIDGGIPFSIEKPCGLKASDVANVRVRAEAAQLFVSVPFHYRLSGMAQSLAAVMLGPSADFSAMSFRVNAGSPSRFADSSPCLANAALAGGGCMMNLAHHPIDFALQLSGGTVVEIDARTSHKLLGLDVEDHALLELTLSDGALIAIETGYTHPVSQGSYMDFGMALTHKNFTADRTPDGLLVRRGAMARRPPSRPTGCSSGSSPSMSAGPCIC
jgi:predicted dehydrogenase